MKKNLLLLFLFLCALSCKSPEESYTMPVYDESSFQVVTIKPGEFDDKYSDIYKYVDSIEFVPLETNDELLIGNIEKLIVWKDQYII